MECKLKAWKGQTEFCSREVNYEAEGLLAQSNCSRTASQAGSS